MTAHQQQSFLRALASGCTVAEAARHAGASSSAFYNLRSKDADFRAAWETALEDSADILEAEARRRAIEGAEELVVYQGQLTPVWERDDKGAVVMDGDNPVQARNPDGSLRWLTVRKPSDSLLALLLKGRRKSVFSDRTEITGADGGAVQMTTTEIASRAARLLDVWRARAKGAE